MDQHFIIVILDKNKPTYLIADPEIIDRSKDVFSNKTTFCQSIFYNKLWE